MVLVSVFARVEIDIMSASQKDVSNQMSVPPKDVSSRVTAKSPNLITKCQIWAFVYIQKKEVLKLTEFNHTYTVKNRYCVSFCAP